MNSKIYGLDKVLSHLADYNDCYVIIGGTATKILLEDQGLEFRETKDLDIVLLADGSNKEFANSIAMFLKQGKYQNAFSNGRRVCYRFINPETNGYPLIVELFAGENSKSIEKYLKKIPIVIDDEQLSAIVLEQEAFEFARLRKVLSKEQVPIIDPLGLIVLKSYAYFENLALYEKKIIMEKGKYLKHKSDVIRLLLSLKSGEQPIDVPIFLKDYCKRFVDVLKSSNDTYRNIPHGSVNLHNLVELYKRLFLGE